MLIIDRKRDEWVHIRLGDTLVRVACRDRGGGYVKLAFDAPPEVKIVREELARDGWAELDHTRGA